MNGAGSLGNATKRSNGALPSIYVRTIKRPRTSRSPDSLLWNFVHASIMTEKSEDLEREKSVTFTRIWVILRQGKKNTKFPDDVISHLHAIAKYKLFHYCFSTKSFLSASNYDKNKIKLNFYQLSIVGVRENSAFEFWVNVEKKLIILNKLRKTWMWANGKKSMKFNTNVVYSIGKSR